MGGGTNGLIRNNWSQSGAVRNQFAGGYDSYNGTPRGYSHPYAWIMPTKDGGMATTAGGIAGSGAISNADAVRGGPVTATLSGVGTISSASAALVTAIAATLAGVGAVSNADMALASALAATLTGTGAISSAQLDAIVGMIASLSGTGAMSPDLTELGHLSADISPFTELSPENLANQILDANEIELGYSLREAMRLVLSALAGKVSGAETTTVTIRNITDGKSRIVATVDANGNRTEVTYDVEDE